MCVYIRYEGQDEKKKKKKKKKKKRSDCERCDS